jgi:hypothetical protein
VLHLPTARGPGDGDVYVHTDADAYQLDGSILGPDGAPGAPGEPGDPGRDSDVPGPEGPPGESITGPAGPPGQDSTVPGPKGDTGEAGLNWRGEWSGLEVYERNDAVSRAGSSYRALSNNNATPPPNATYWAIVAAKGDTGDRGPAGPQGERGPMGPPGQGDGGGSRPPGERGSRYALVEEVAEALNINRELSPDEVVRIWRCIESSSAEIDAAIGWYGDEPDPGSWNDSEYSLANSICIVRSVEWWKANDAAFGVVGSSETGILRTPREGFERHRNVLMPLIESFGIA